MTKKNINILLCSSNEFIEHCATTMVSILYNLSNDYMAHFYILSYDLTDKNKKKLEKLNKIKKCIIEYPSFDEKDLEIFDNIKIPGHVANKIAFVRILAPKLLTDVDKLIYFDSDIMVRADISGLYQEDIENYYFAAVEDGNNKGLAKRLWGVDTTSDYFNSGVLIMNCKLLRNDNYMQKIKNQVNLNASKYIIADQDVINDTFKDKIKKLDITWNFHHGKFFECGAFIFPNKEEFFDIMNNPNVWHLTGPDKPWLAGIKHGGQREYLFYEKLTPFYQIFKFQKYKYNDSTREVFSIYDKAIYLKEHNKNYNLYCILGIKIHFNKKTNFLKKIVFSIISTKYQNNLWQLSLLNFPIIKKLNAPEKKYLKIIGIPFYYKKKNELLKNIDQLRILITNQERILNNQNNMINYLNRKISNLKVVIEAQKLHEKTFGKYKNAFAGKDVVLVCTGPTAKNYKPIKGAIHVGVNGAIYLNQVKLDYLFVQDNTIHQKVNNTLNIDANKYKGNNCKKFYGIIPEYRLKQVCSTIERIPLNYSYDGNISQYLLEDGSLGNIAYDLSREPIADCGGTSCSALQFILYTNPKRLYLVGWDCGSGYAYNKPNAMAPVNFQIDIVKNHYLPFIKVNYPNIEIISINPVGLKGIFKDEVMQ